MNKSDLKRFKMYFNTGKKIKKPETKTEKEIYKLVEKVFSIEGESAPIYFNTIVVTCRRSRSNPKQCNYFTYVYADNRVDVTKEVADLVCNSTVRSSTSKDYTGAIMLPSMIYTPVKENRAGELRRIVVEYIYKELKKKISGSAYEELFDIDDVRCVDIIPDQTRNIIKAYAGK